VSLSPIVRCVVVSTIVPMYGIVIILLCRYARSGIMSLVYYLAGRKKRAGTRLPVGFARNRDIVALVQKKRM
jgi:hypothetical protein